MAKKADETGTILATIASWPDEQRQIGERLHAAITEAAPDLRPKQYYRQPGYAHAGGPVIVFFRNDDGLMSFGLTEKATFSATTPLVPSASFVNRIDADAEQRIATIVRDAAG